MAWLLNDTIRPDKRAVELYIKFVDVGKTVV